MDEEKLSTSVHSIAGAVAGYLSNFTGSPLHALGVAVILLLVVGNVMKQVVEGDGSKWWIGNGAAPYIFMWLVFSVLFYNL